VDDFPHNLGIGMEAATPKIIAEQDHVRVPRPIILCR
jgi:hypothetical protein